MKVFIPLAILALLAVAIFYVKTKGKSVEVIDVQSDTPSIHSLTAEGLLSDEIISLDQYKGKAMLVVNTASKCGLTPQYEQIQALHESYADKGLAVLGFPSGDFMNQEFSDEEEIADFCEKNYGVSFQMFEKVSVKGKDKHPVYQFLTEKEKNGVLDSKVTWNFQKYLLDEEGRLVATFNPKTTVDDPKFVNRLDSLLKL